MTRAERYQITLILSGIVATVLLGCFFFRELFPEYRIYQDDYIALEKFRSTYTGEPVPPFQTGVKQIVQEREDKGPPEIDRCISCHVALQLPHFSPTKIAHDINGNMVLDDKGIPVQVPNENYIWVKLDEKIAQLTDDQVNTQLKQQGQTSNVAVRLKEAETLKALKTAKVDDHVYDVTQVLSMHPLIGKETRPFEFHPLEEYGCVSCHNGNGKGLTTEKAHGPVFDGEYEIEFMGPKLEFLEKDPENDPKFSRVFNDKPGHELLFQTSPIFVGNLIQAKCMQCHEQSAIAIRGIADVAGTLTSQRIKRSNAILKGFKNEKQALLTLIKLKSQLNKSNLADVLTSYQQQIDNPALTPSEHQQLTSILSMLKSPTANKLDQKQLITDIDRFIIAMLGSLSLEEALSKNLAASSLDDQNQEKILDTFLEKEHTNPDSTGTLFAKWEAVHLEQDLLRHIEKTQNSLSKTVNDETTISAMSTDIDWLTKDYHRGQQLFVSQACYACHRISGLARGGVGPELTRAGESYPWYLKESIVWPQADLRTSTMPNFQLDHVELEDLMTFLLGQKGPSKAVSATEYKIAVQEWEAGKKMPWENPISPTQVHDLRYAMTVFATQGCAACHRLKGFESNVGYSIQKGDKKPSFEELYAESQWFQKLFPESASGSEIVQTLEKHAEEIDKRIVNDVRKGSIIEELEANHPDSIEALYSNFRFASRAKNHTDAILAAQAFNKEEKEAALKQTQAWQNRVKRVLMVYIQEYGLGRLIGPRPNWSGVYRSDEWLMEHFRNPAGHVPRSIMPIMPFDTSKFYALTYMLDALGKKNRDAVRDIWEHHGFSPEQAFDIHCAQCHGDYLQGNGPVATWIYPVPKNLRNAEFLRNLTKKEAIHSITHGVKGTPMGPWGEAPEDKINYDGIPVLTREEVAKLVDWLYTSLPGANVIKGAQDVPKWHYTPKDVIDELKREGSSLKPEASPERHSSNSIKLPSELLALFPTGESYYAALQPIVPIEAKSNDQEGVDQIFDIIPNQPSAEDKNAYYIKKQFYTADNIERGKHFFEMNCASCHGKEADGSGMRASIMFDAKPRMLTNLDWIKTHDDLRLLRSIKYGVAGTAMTPWGDQTSALQRLQLVIFIRSLSEEKEFREILSESIYRAFESTQIQIEQARSAIYPTLDRLNAQSNKLRTEQSSADLPDNTGEASLYKEALNLYEQQLKLASQEKEWQALDQLLLDLKALISQESDIYQAIGFDLIALNLKGMAWSDLLKAVSLNENILISKDQTLQMSFDETKTNQLNKLLNGIATHIEDKYTDTNKEISVLQTQAASTERDSKLSALKAKADAYRLARGKVLAGIEQLKKLTRQQIELLKTYQEKLKDLANNS